MQALAAGAVTIVTKPKIGVRNFLLDASADLVEAVKVASRANLRNLRPATTAELVERAAPPATPLKETSESVVALGTSTGGTQALEFVLPRSPQLAWHRRGAAHAGKVHCGVLAAPERCLRNRSEGSAGQRPCAAGCALIAPGGKQMTLKRSGALYYVEVRGAPPVNRHCPSVDVLFRSVAKHAAGTHWGSS